jgi:hypothetical protein
MIFENEIKGNIYSKEMTEVYIQGWINSGTNLVQKNSVINVKGNIYNSGVLKFESDLAMTV